MMGKVASFVLVLTLLCLLPPFLYYQSFGGGTLYTDFYDHSCPKAQEIVGSIVAKAVATDTRMAASLMRLHFHDCFVQGCDGSVLLDSSGTIVSEKNSNPNRISAREFEVIDEVKAALEKACPDTVSCADALALAARDSCVLMGGPNWDVPLGRRDSRGASLSGSNDNIPGPNSTFRTVLSMFNRRGLDVIDLVALCVLDIVGATKFDNSYFKNLRHNKGLFKSHQVLFQKAAELVKKYAEHEEEFFKQFAESMVKMGNISPLTGSNGEIRKNCRKVNYS